MPKTTAPTAQEPQAHQERQVERTATQDEDTKVVAVVPEEAAVVEDNTDMADAAAAEDQARMRRSKEIQPP